MEKRWNLVLLGVAALASGLYLPTLSYDLVWDDKYLLNVLVRETNSGGVPGLLAAGFRLYPDQPAAYYRPVAMASLWFDRLLSGVFPYSFHLTNVLVHAAVSALVASAGRLLTGSPSAGLLAGLLFAVHPSHVESVAFVSGRTDLFAALFGALSLLCWLRDRSGAPSRWLPWPAWGGLAYLLSCLSKEVGVLLPAVLLSWDALSPAGAGESPRGGWWSRNRWWCASWGLSLAAVVALRWGVAGLPPVPGGSYAGSHVEEALRDRALIPSMWLEYLRMLVIPWPTRIIYTPEFLGLTVWTAAGALGFGALAWATSGASSRRAGVWGLFWVAAFLLPVSGVVPLHGAIVAERFLYLPSAGFCVMAGAAASRLAERLRLPRTAPAAVAAGVLALLSAGVLSASRHWKDEVTLFTRVIRTTPGAWMAYLNLGKAKADRGDLREAIGLYEAAIRIRPDYAEAYFSLGVLHAREKRYPEALYALGRAVALKPAFSEAHSNLGSVYHDLGQYGKAVESFRRAVEAEPKLGQAWANMGRSYFRLGRDGEALAAFDEAIRVWPDYSAAHADRGFTLNRLRKWDEAAASFREALRLDPANADARRGLADAHIGAGRREEAERTLRERADRGEPDHRAYNDLGILHGRGGSHAEAAAAFENAVRAKPDAPEYRFNLGLAYLRLGRHPEAAKSFGEAVRLAPENPLYRFELGTALLSAGDRAGAARERDALKGLDPKLAGRLSGELSRNRGR